MSEELFKKLFDMDTKQMKLMCKEHKKLKGKLEATKKKNLELKSLCKEASDYLDINHLTSICNGSILHRKFKDSAKGNR